MIVIRTKKRDEEIKGEIAWDAYKNGREFQKYKNKEGLRLPKETYRLEDAQTGEVIADNGVWIRMPDDGQILKVINKQNYERFKDNKTGGTPLPDTGDVRS